MGNLRSREALINSAWDWHFLNECFGNTGIKVSDIDGCIERKGKALFIETKRPGEEISKGQGYMYTSLTKMVKGNAWMVIQGDYDSDSFEINLAIWNGGPELLTYNFDGGRARIADAVKYWFDNYGNI